MVCEYPWHKIFPIPHFNCLF